MALRYRISYLRYRSQLIYIGVRNRISLTISLWKFQIFFFFGDFSGFSILSTKSKNTDFFFLFLPSRSRRRYRSKSISSTISHLVDTYRLWAIKSDIADDIDLFERYRRRYDFAKPARRSWSAYRSATAMLAPARHRIHCDTLAIINMNDALKYMYTHL